MSTDAAAPPIRILVPGAMVHALRWTGLNEFSLLTSVGAFPAGGDKIVFISAEDRVLLEPLL